MELAHREQQRRELIEREQTPEANEVLPSRSEKYREKRKKKTHPTGHESTPDRGDPIAENRVDGSESRVEGSGAENRTDGSGANVRVDQAAGYMSEVIEYIPEANIEELLEEFRYQEKELTTQLSQQLTAADSSVSSSSPNRLRMVAPHRAAPDLSANLFAQVSASPSPTSPANSKTSALTQSSVFSTSQLPFFELARSSSGDSFHNNV